MPCQIAIGGVDKLMTFIFPGKLNFSLQVSFLQEVPTSSWLLIVSQIILR